MRKGLLKKAFPSDSKAMKSMEKAERFLRTAQMNMNARAYDGSVIMAYLAVFNAARSVLIRDGFRERSHACISRYLEKHYVPGKLKREHIMLLDRYRNLRHSDQYDVSFYADERDASSMIGFAVELISEIKRILADRRIITR